MDPAFYYQNGHAYCEGVALAKVVQTYGSPAYVYSAAVVRQRCATVREALGDAPGLACFAVKANSNLSLLNLIFSQGLGADVVSLGELERALRADCSRERIVFSGVGKREDEILRALQVGIKAINVESVTELDMIEAQAKKLDRVARVALRVNPNIDAGTHPKIATGLHCTKFGVSELQVRDILLASAKWPHLEFIGLSCHLGSQIASLGPYREAASRMAALARFVIEHGHRIEFVDMGGGMAIQYADETLPPFSEYVAVIREQLSGLGCELLLEPGRYIVGPAGLLLTTVILTKDTPEKHFVIVDAAMNDLLRPTLYGAYHEVYPLRQDKAKRLERFGKVSDFVGPICETGDTLAESRLVADVEAGDGFAFANCGAYAAVMASRYNSRPTAVELMVDGSGVRVIKDRETLSDILAAEARHLVKQRNHQESGQGSSQHDE